MTHIAILQKWEGESDFSLVIQYPATKEAEARKLFAHLNKERKDRKFPVEYKIIELDGDYQKFAKFDIGKKRKGLFIP